MNDARVLLGLRRFGGVWFYLLLLTVAGCSPKEQPPSTPAKQTALETGLDRLDERLGAIEGQLTEMANRRASFGEPTFSFTVPSETQQRLQELEDIVAEKGKWPTNPAEAEHLRQELEELVTSLAPPIQESILPRLLPLRWAVRAIWTMRVAETAEENQLTDVADDLGSLLAIEPDATADELRSAVEEALLRVEGAAERHFRATAIATARKAIEGSGSAAQAWDALRGFSDGDEEIALLRRDLRKRITLEDIVVQVKQLRDRLGRVERLSDEVSQQTALSQLYESAVRYKVDLVLGSDESPSKIDNLESVIQAIEKEMRTAAQNQQRRQDMPSRDYQRWALKRIRTFQQWHYDASLKNAQDTFEKMEAADAALQWKLLERFPSVRALLTDKTRITIPAGKLSAKKQREIYDKVAGYVGWNGYDEEIAYRVTRDAMVKYLAPIDERLLDKPVLLLYNKAFAQGWSKLEGRGDQLYVAQQAAVVSKCRLGQTNNGS